MQRHVGKDGLALLAKDLKERGRLKKLHQQSQAEVTPSGFVEASVAENARVAEVEANEGTLAEKIEASNVAAEVEANEGRLAENIEEKVEEKIEDTSEEESEEYNYPMYVCNSICSQCANGDVVFIRRAMTWKHFAARAAWEVTVGSLTTVTGVSGVGTVVGYAVTAASEAISRRADLLSLPNECRALAVLRTTDDDNSTNASAVLHPISKEDVHAQKELALYMKNMNVIAQKEKDAVGGLSWKGWGKRMIGMEQLYETPGQVPLSIEELTAEMFCGNAGGLMRSNESDNASSIIEIMPGNLSNGRNRSVIEQESNWAAFRRSVSTAGGLRDRAVNKCHMLSDKLGLAASNEEKDEDEVVVDHVEEAVGANESVSMEAMEAMITNATEANVTSDEDLTDSESQPSKNSTWSWFSRRRGTRRLPSTAGAMSVASGTTQRAAEGLEQLGGMEGKACTFTSSLIRSAALTVAAMSLC